jgi:hypothetical protein
MVCRLSFKEYPPIFFGDYVLGPSITITVFNLSVAANLSAAQLFTAL